MGWKTFQISSIILLIVSIPTVLPAQPGTLVFADDFSNATDGWIGMGLDQSRGSMEIQDGNLSVNLQGGSSYGAYFSKRAFSGHFAVEVSFVSDHGLGIALIQDHNGSPSWQNYSMLTVMTNAQGIPELSLRDQQDGVKNVLDNTKLADSARYTHLLSGQEYSIPYDRTAKKIRIFRHEKEQFLHFYYAVEKEINGKIYQDWMELAPSKEWGRGAQAYYIGLFALEGVVQFDEVKVTQLPLADQKDLETGFRISKRPYTWTGYTADALVVTFGEQFPYFKEGVKWVFWELANNIPVWHVNDYTLFSHGFVETWDGGNPGCHEPMSDRLLAFSALDIVEDNAVRKVIKWSYQLVNPDYKVPTHNQGRQLPEVTEYYFIYADGGILRKIQYAPKLDTDFRNWHELMELMVIAGGNHRPGDLLDRPSLTFQDIGSFTQVHHNDRKTKYRNRNERLGATTMLAHLKNAPDFFIAFSDDESVTSTHPDIPFDYEVSWHDRSYNFGHWPINKEPYLKNDPAKSWSAWPEQVAHTSLVGMGVTQGQDWKDRYRQYPNGRKYRQWIALLGIDDGDDAITPEDKTKAWLFPGVIRMLDNQSSFIRYSHEDRAFEFQMNPSLSECHFSITPSSKLINPVLMLNNWGDKDLRITIDDRPLSPSQYVQSREQDGKILVLIPEVYHKEIQVKLSAN